ncbi:MAG: hypothetical protein M1440_05265, partial [Gammaproteobacteria bacterium]|nr:hypothetical protein [Gammaproteobacteria bacterium]
VVASDAFYRVAPCCQAPSHRKIIANLLTEKSFLKTALLSKTRIIGRSELPSSFSSLKPINACDIPARHAKAPQGGAFCSQSAVNLT